MISTLCVVPCGKEKIWKKYPKAGPTPARKVYTGTFAKKCRQYAEKFYGEEYVILSAKYGFLRPNEMVPGDYEVTFKKKKTNPIELDQLKKQAAEMGLDEYDEIVVIAGKDYANIVKEVFRGKRISVPLKGKNMFEMMRLMNQAIRMGTRIG